MMFKWLRKIFPTRNERIIKKYQEYLYKINDLESDMRCIDDETLKYKTDEFRKRLDEGEELDDLIHESFAVVREVSDRRLGILNFLEKEDEEVDELLKDHPELLLEAQRGREEFKKNKEHHSVEFKAEFYKEFREKIKDPEYRYRPFDVQILGGIALHRGRIAEMKTGEGKTVSSTMPIYLNALTGNGVHIVTVNDYLASRDSEWMGKIYRFLQMKVGIIYHDIPLKEKREAYIADITYGTNNEFGFDYLRDNMVFTKEECVQRGHYFAIIDEVDSILIDEARTPLIISGPTGKPTGLYLKFSRLGRKLKEETDFQIDEKARTVVLTESGITKVETELGLNNLYDPSNIEVSHHILAALKARCLFKRDVDYVVKDGEVQIVDEFTGRLMPGRRWSEGLHQAVEAKEGVKIEEENQTLATITLQNYFRMYEKLAGMTGTAETERKEFLHIYGLDVVELPTNRALIRDDAADVIFKTRNEKYRQIAMEIVRAHERGQPVLVGTISIEVSEMLGKMIRNQGIECNVLNAKYHEKEAEIVAEAGQANAITIATNMAGRGTDIKLGKGVVKCKKCCLSCEDGLNSDACNDCESKQSGKECKYDVPCGLYIIGTERHESRRIDNQLRGRSGRQGDPGMTRFFLSLEDDLMRLFGSDRIAGMMDTLGLEEDQPIEHRFITNAIERAQKRVEERNFSIRKQVLEYDNVMNLQRVAIYVERRTLLFEDDIKENIISMQGTVLEELTGLSFASSIPIDQRDYDKYIEKVKSVFPIEFSSSDIDELDIEDIIAFLMPLINKKYEQREIEIGTDQLRMLERILLLEILDQSWKEHLLNMDYLEEGIGLRAYGHKDPLVEYKTEGYYMFQNMLYNIKEEVITFLFRVQVDREQEEFERKKEEQIMFTNAGDGEGMAKKPVKRKSPKIKPNSPCPCGSGEKYKKCCGLKK